MKLQALKDSKCITTAHAANTWCWALWQHRTLVLIGLWLVSWCFKPSQPQRIISGLKETFIKRYIVERTNKAEIRPEEQREKVENCGENLLNEIQLKGP